MDRGSQDEIIDALAKELDVTLLEQCLKLTPTERLERMRKMLEFLDSLKRNDARLPQPH